ncbi:MAG: hypothetical protein ACPGWR_02130 [Ardenticatenaceae bacterium]
MARRKKRKDGQDDQYDSPWKEIIEQYFEEFMTFFFPKAASEIDWSRGYEFLDKELQKVVREATSTEGRVDKLVKVWRKTGQQAWVYIHIDIQSQYETGFGKRMFMYNYRIFDRYQQPVATLVIYGDDRPTWEPNHYGYELWGCEVNIKFPTVKLLDYTDKKTWAELDKSDNPFAVVVKAHLHTKYTKNKPQQRYKIKWQLTRNLYERGYSKKDVLNLFRFIDWVMTLPKELTQQFKEQVAEHEEEQKMRYITSIERLGMEKGMELGIQQGMQQGMQQEAVQSAREHVLDALQTRFQNVSLPQSMVQTVNTISDRALLKKLHRHAILVESFNKFEQELGSVTNGQ